MVSREREPIFPSQWCREMLVFSAADFEDFLQPRPDLPDNMDAELEAVIRHG